MAPLARIERETWIGALPRLGDQVMRLEPCRSAPRVLWLEAACHKEPKPCPWRPTRRDLERHGAGLRPVWPPPPRSRHAPHEPLSRTTKL